MGIFTYDYTLDTETLEFEREDYAREDREYASAYVADAYSDSKGEAEYDEY